MLKCLFAVAALLALAAPAHAVEFTCEQAQWAARTFSRETLETWGRALGVTDEERARAQACIAAPAPKRGGKR